MRTVVGIDQNVGDILALLDDLEIADNTAVIFISDNGFFRGEHRLGDKRSAYEESLRNSLDDSLSLPVNRSHLPWIQLP
jgi:arylsulfatase A-like enzyme